MFCDQNLDVFPNHSLNNNNSLCKPLHSALLSASNKLVVWLGALHALFALAHPVCGPEVPSHASVSGGAEGSAGASGLHNRILANSVPVADLDLPLEHAGVSGSATVAATPAPALILTSTGGGCLRITPAIVVVGVVTVELTSLDAITIGGALSLSLSLGNVTGLVTAADVFTLGP